MCQCGDNVKVLLLVWRTMYTDTFCDAVDCRFEQALEVQRWTKARSECLPGGGQKLQLRPRARTGLRAEQADTGTDRGSRRRRRRRLAGRCGHAATEDRSR